MLRRAEKCPEDPLENFLDYKRYVLLNSIVNITGNAAASIPCGFHEGLPVGLMLIARRGREDLLLRAAAAFEQAWP
jgi:Asp-tRNA(Asn)/Glu-tRNA(Gln) amidotransferase A subunit family amidase